VTPMFDVIAPRYDAFTRLFSLGMDAGWKHALIDATVLRAANARTALDLACGTGDLGLALAARIATMRVTGIDPSSEMLARARGRCASGDDGRVTFTLGEMSALPCTDGSIDAITVGYGFRNVPDVAAAVRECARVLAPGGVLGSLEFFVPTNAIWRALFLGYLRVAGDLVGWWWHRTPAIYGYIARSIAQFMSAAEFARLLKAHGFTVVEQRSRLLGGIAMHIAVRDA
jgi:demethylmenaquinone methyltransferase / 2-methoxy-6-polyprenyl-1,4-benzoquinol methylase